MTDAPAHLLHVFPTFVAAGAQTRVVQLMAGFDDAYRHSVLALDGRTDALALVPDPVDARAVRVPDVHGVAHGVRGARALLLQEKPDLLLTYNWGSFDAVLAARALRLRAHVHHEDGFNVDEAGRQKRRRVLARRFGLRRAHRIVVPSKQLLSIACDVWKLPKARVQLISNGVHMDRFRPDATDQGMRHELGIPRDALVVGAVGHLRPVKNFARLFRACAALRTEGLDGREVHVLLLGDGVERESLARVAETHRPPGGRVHFAGHRDDLSSAYRAMDVLAISSDSEQQPVSLLEAMATGVPVAATDVGDVGDVLPPEGRGFLAPLDSPDVDAALAAAIEALLADPERRRELGELGRRRAAESYSFQAMLATYRALYDGAIAAGTGGIKGR